MLPKLPKTDNDWQWLTLLSIEPTKTTKQDNRWLLTNESEINDKDRSKITVSSHFGLVFKEIIQKRRLISQLSVKCEFCSDHKKKHFLLLTRYNSEFSVDCVRAVTSILCCLNDGPPEHLCQGQKRGEYPDKCDDDWTPPVCHLVVVLNWLWHCPVSVKPRDRTKSLFITNLDLLITGLNLGVKNPNKLLYWIPLNYRSLFISKIQCKTCNFADHFHFEAFVDKNKNNTILKISEFLQIVLFFKLQALSFAKKNTFKKVAMFKRLVKRINLK